MNRPDDRNRAKAVFRKVGPVERTRFGPVTEISAGQGFTTRETLVPDALKALR